MNQNMFAFLRSLTDFTDLAALSQMGRGEHTMPADISHIKPQYARSENGAKHQSAEQRVKQANLIKQECEGLSRFEGPRIKRVS